MIKCDMAEIERITITVTSDLVTDMKAAIADGDYASVSEIVRDALRDWRVKRLGEQQKLAELRAIVEEGFADLVDRRVSELDPGEIIARVRRRANKARRSKKTPATE